MPLENMLKNATCNICGEKGKFIISNLNPELDKITQLREDIICQSCGSISRDRMMVYCFQKALGTSTPLSKMKPNKKFRVLETSGTRGHPKYLENLYDYYNILYEPEIIKNENFDVRKYGDLQNLHFQDENFDAILSSDVFEHVRLYKKAFLEVFRVLKQGGFFILQIPFLELEKKNVEFVEALGDKDIYLAPPQYHAANTLVYRTYGGLDLIPLLWRIGFYVRFIETEIPKHAISWQNVILCIKHFTNFPFGHKVRKGRVHSYFRRGDQNAQRKGKLRRHSEVGTKRGVVRLYKT